MKGVSVVIPSYRRHREVLRAVRSALGQSLSPREVIVANDGPDPEKGQLLEELKDERLRFLEAPRRASASATRNYGIQQATGEWIALLDDDDVWLPEKLSAQFEALRQVGFDEAIVAGVERVIAPSGSSRLRPKGVPAGGISVDQLLFGGCGGANTSTLLAPRWAFQRYPFDEELERHEDWQWMLQVGQELPVIVAAEVVCERYLRPGEGLSRAGGFAFTRGWYEANRERMSNSARAKFVAGILSRKAAHDLHLTALPWLVHEHSKNAGGLAGSARLLSAWLLPGKARGCVRTLLGKG